MKNNKIYMSLNKVSLPEERKKEILLNTISIIKSNQTKPKLNKKLVLIPIFSMLVVAFIINTLFTNSAISRKNYSENKTNNNIVEELLYVNRIEENIDLSNANIDMIEESIEKNKICAYEEIGDYTLKKAFANYFRDSDNIYKNLVWIELLYGNKENAKFSIILSEEYLYKYKTLLEGEDVLKSKLLNTEVYIFNNENSYYAIFEKGDIKYYIKADEITEPYFISLLKDIIESDYYTIINIEKSTEREYKTLYDMLIEPEYYYLLVKE